MTSGIPLTGERTVPGVPSENYWFQRHVAAYRFAARLTRGTVIDAGCGEGYGAEILAGRGQRVVGLDLDEPTLAHARRSYASPRYVRCDLENPPLAPASVDAIVALQVVEHLEDPEAFVGGCAEALRPSGVLVVSTPNRATFPAGLNPFHTKEYEAAELGDLLARHFPKVRMLGVDHGTLLRSLERMLGEPMQHRLVRTEYAELPSMLRAALRAVSARAFRLTEDPATALDLLAVCREAPTG